MRRRGISLSWVIIGFALMVAAFMIIFLLVVGI